MRVTDKHTVVLRVTRAHFDDGVWTATTVAGTTAFDAPAFNGCAEGHAKTATAGTRVSA